MNDTPKHLIHQNERKYFVIAVVFSILTYVSLIFSIIGIVYVGLFLAISMLLHVLMLGHIRINGVRLNPDQFPKVYDKVKELSIKMEMRFVPDVYVLESSGALNAFATRFFGRNMVVLYSTIFELVEEAAEDELSFVIAHELAHIKRRHISMQLLVLPAMWIPFVTQAYSRACEYTCDRIAAYYTENSEAAKNCLTILGVGKILYKQVNRTSYLNQINEEKGFVIWLSEVLSTHPPLPKRINEIGFFMDNGYSTAEKHSSKKVWIGLFTAVLLLAGAVGGGIYVFKQLDVAALVQEIEASANLGSTSPLMEAVISGDAQQVNNLLQKGENIDAQDAEGWTSLYWAVQASDIEMTKILLNAGANPNIENYYGVVPIMTAAGNGSLEIVQLLLDTEAVIDHQDYDGRTPLMYAVSFEQTNAVQQLLESGADVKIKDHENSTALMHAIRRGNQEITVLLRT